ncbi:hypothetical protein [Streptomyces curacoi]|uniref:DNA primase n=1 Tax=Streptomyces curacoi TaxID=146536 RepID=A0A124GW08_9ACTN|nr:hypothetical protein [Streptomyces curacoi]KUM69406.1 hypothetical protein AQI70_32090 [Streptomyces curacoi]
MNNAKIGAALLGGYVLGRTKKAKAAIGLGALLAGSRIKPGQVGKTLQQSPFVHTLTDQVRTELADAGKAAATSVLTAKADSLADALHERTAGLREKAHGRPERDTGRSEESEDEPEEEEVTDEDVTDEEQPDKGEKDKAETDEDEEPREEAPRRAGRARARGGRSGPDEEQPRKRKTSTSQSRSRGTGATRSRRQDDG